MRKCQLNSPRTTLLQLIIVAVSLFGNTSGSKGRYDGRSMTLITSNLSPRELAQRLNNATDGDNLNGSRIFDRLKEICKPILFKGTTRRN